MLHPMGTYNCQGPAVSSIAWLVLSWAVLVSILLISVGGAVVILRRALDPTVPASADAALRAAGIRTVLGGGMLVVGGHAIDMVGEIMSFTGGTACTSQAWWYTPVQQGFVGGILVLIWCLTVYVLAPARRPTRVVVTPAPGLVAVS
jgi:hypothetical protein